MKKSSRAAGTVVAWDDVDAAAEVDALRRLEHRQHLRRSVDVLLVVPDVHHVAGHDDRRRAVGGARGGGEAVAVHLPAALAHAYLRIAEVVDGLRALGGWGGRGRGGWGGRRGRGIGGRVALVLAPAEQRVE